MLTFTQRRDMPGYQCFRGNIKRNGDEAFIAEIGESCIRGEDPSINEMKITKTASCQRTPAASYVPVLSWESKAADKLPNSLPKQRVQTTINGRHQGEQATNNNLPTIHSGNLNNYNNFNGHNVNPVQRYGDQPQNANAPHVVNGPSHGDSNLIYPAGVSNRPQLVIVNNDHYQSEQSNGKRKSMVTKRPQRVPYLNYNYNSFAPRSVVLNAGLFCCAIVAAIFCHFRFSRSL